MNKRLFLPFSLILFTIVSIVSAAPGHALSLDDRVMQERAVEEVLWKHRLWPSAKTQKPDFQTVVSEIDIARRIEEALKKSNALEAYWKRPITSQDLQGEIDRITTHTQQPSVLKEIFDALNDDPFLIAEILARPLLADRMIRESFKQDRILRTKSFEKWWTDVRDSISPDAVVRSATYTVQPLQTNAYCTDDTWTPISLENEPEARAGHTAVWTGTEMIIWGGSDSEQDFANGSRYQPSTDSWIPLTTVNAPAARGIHTAVWTGMEMIVWGGVHVENSDQTSLNSGGRYNPATDTWLPTNITDAPQSRYAHTAVWTGTEMIIWGGSHVDTPSEFLNDGGRYDPATDSWTLIPPDFLEPRFDHVAFWTGNEMLVWGGSPTPNHGGRYDPVTETWLPITMVDAPDGGDTGVWSGLEMLLWGDGAIPGAGYHPDMWHAISDQNQPEPRVLHSAVWTGNEMIIWGGITDTYTASGGRYSPDFDGWQPTSQADAPLARAAHTAVWTGKVMIVWGGNDEEGVMSLGGAYCAAPPVLPIAISVKKVNPNSNGKIKVKLLGNESFSVANVNLSTVRFGPTGVEATVVSSKMKDVDHDSHMDLTLKFSIPETQITCGDTLVTLNGQLNTGESFTATAVIRTTHCN